MKRKISVILMCAVVAISCLIGLCACNGRQGDGVVLKTGGKPEYASIFKDGDMSVINASLDNGASENIKKAAVMALFNTANASRLDTETSLMLQSSDAGIDMGDVIMHGFNLRSGNKWYYQLATEASSSDSFLNFIMSNIAGLLKMAYTEDGQNFYYTVIQGSEPECDCSVETFPYATFKVTKEPDLLNADEFKEQLHYLNGMHEINNMKFCADIIADGAKITYDSAGGFYKAEFSVDMNADSELLEQWFALPKEDMKVGGQTLEYYEYYNAVLEVWDNGYAKSFKSSAKREAGAGSGSPTDSFEYFWNEDEILALLNDDKSIASDMHAMMFNIDSYITYYSNPELTAAKLGTLKLAGIIIGSVLGVLLIGVIIAVIVIKSLLKKGKLPKLAARQEAKKLKRAQKKARKNGEPDLSMTEGTAAESEDTFDHTPEKQNDSCEYRNEEQIFSTEAEGGAGDSDDSETD